MKRGWQRLFCSRSCLGTAGDVYTRVYMCADSFICVYVYKFVF